MNPGFDEPTARQVLLVQAFETAAVGSPLWTPEDQAWATRVAGDSARDRARDSAGDSPGRSAAPEHFLAERARHALQRLLPRDPPLRRWFEAAGWSPTWPLFALLFGAAAGLATDAIGAGQRINLLAPPVWALLLWNLVVYAALGVQALRRREQKRAAPGPWRRVLLRWPQRWRTPPAGAAVQAFMLNWGRVSAGLQGARLALLLHLAALALGAGLVLGLYVRGLVLDYRAGWQSTFLDAPAVHAVLATLLAPAGAVSGISVPPVEVLAAQRVLPGAEATAAAAPWIHLYATTIALFVLLPRALLAAVAALQAHRLAHGGLQMPLDEPYFRRLLQRQAGGATVVQLWAYGAPASAQAALGLRSLLAAAGGGAEVELLVAPTTAHGSEDLGPVDDRGGTLRIALFDLAATPEDEAQGRFIAALRRRGTTPLLAVVDEAAFRQRFRSLPERIDERRAAWQSWARRHAVALWCGDLGEPDAASARAVFGPLLGP